MRFPVVRGERRNQDSVRSVTTPEDLPAEIRTDKRTDRSWSSYLDPAATLEPLLLKVTCVAFVVNRVRMPSGSPSGKVWICTVLLELAVTSFPFCGWKARLSHWLTDLPSDLCPRLTNLQGQGVHLFSHCDELWIVIIQTLPYPDVSIMTTGYEEPANIKCSQ